MGTRITMQNIAGSKAALIEGEHGSSTLEVFDSSGSSVVLFFSKDQFNIAAVISLTINDAVDYRVEVA